MHIPFIVQQSHKSRAGGKILKYPDTANEEESIHLEHKIGVLAGNVQPMNFRLYNHCGGHSEYKVS